MRLINSGTQYPQIPKMYGDLKLLYLWLTMSICIAKYISSCLACLLVKIEHQCPYGDLEPLEVPMWKWDKITMDFVTNF